MKKEENIDLLVAEYAVLVTRFNEEERGAEAKKDIRARMREIETLTKLTPEEIGVILVRNYQSQY